MFGYRTLNSSGDTVRTLWLMMIYHQYRLGLQNTVQSHMDYISPQCILVNINNWTVSLPSALPPGLLLIFSLYVGYPATCNMLTVSDFTFHGIPLTHG